MSRVEVELLEDRTAGAPSDSGFIKVLRYTLRTRFADGTSGPPFAYDVVDREALDAVVMVLTHHDSTGAPLVCLRTALRPPVALRARRALIVPEAPTAMLLELPAGLIEPSGASDPVRETAAREAREETGYAVDPAAFETLGPPVFLTPGLCAEKLHFVHAWIERDAPREVTATEVVELPSQIEWVPLSDAIARAERGEIQDCKTELGLRRLRDRLAAR
jgi:ADP-ribose pyrophosphatase